MDSATASGAGFTNLVQQPAAFMVSRSGCATQVALCEVLGFPSWSRALSQRNLSPR